MTILENISISGVRSIEATFPWFGWPLRDEQYYVQDILWETMEFVRTTDPGKEPNDVVELSSVYTMI